MSPVRHGGQLRSALRWRRTLSGANLRQRAWEDGVLGGERRWVVIGGFAWFLWAVQWAWRKDAEVVYRTKVKPGEQIAISTSKPPSKKQAKAEERAVKAAAEAAAAAAKAEKRAAKADKRAGKAAKKRKARKQAKRQQHQSHEPVPT